MGPWAGMAGLITGFQSANGGNDLIQLAALLAIGGSQQQSAMFQSAQVLQARQTLAHQQDTVVAAQHAEVQKRIEAEATKQAAASAGEVTCNCKN